MRLVIRKDKSVVGRKIAIKNETRKVISERIRESNALENGNFKK